MNPAYANAISQIESGGRYDLVGPATSSGDRAYGKYQVMGANVPEWTAQHYGTALTPDQFLQNKDAQDAVFRGQFGSYVNKYGSPQDAASAWFTGGPLSYGATKSDVLGTTGQKYVDMFNKQLNKGPALASNDDDDEDTPAALSANATLGNGMLFAPANAPVNTAAALGSGLTGIGAALAGISNPQQAYSLNQQAQLINKQAKDKEVTYKTVVGKDGTVYRIGDDGSVQTANSAGAANAAALQPPGDASKQGDDYLATLPQAQADYVRKMVSGEIAPPSTGRGGKVPPEMMQLISAASHYDPNFNLSTWQARNAGNKDWFGGGQSQRTQKSLNQLFHHVADLTDTADELGNGQSPMINAGKNWVNSQVRGEAPVNNWMQNAHAVADELSAFYKGSGRNSDHEIKAWIDTLNPNMSPEQQHGAIAKLRQLVQGGIEANTDMRNVAIGPYAAAKAGPLISPDTQKDVDKIDAWITKAQKAAASSSLPKGVSSIKVISPQQ
jgi:hypothetical protein